jgi:F-type H+-transporting ATPase subunit b
VIQVGLDFTLFIQIVQFLIIVFLVRVFIVCPIRATIEARDAKIAELLRRSKTDVELLEAKKAEYNTRLKAVREEIREYSAKLKEAANAQAQAMIEKIKSENYLNFKKAEALIEDEISAAKKSLQNDVESISKQIVESIIK